MSDSATAPPVDATSASFLTAILSCPSCSLRFRDPAAQTGREPVCLGCGHNICADCTDAAEKLDPPQCLVCAQGIETEVVNVALGVYAEETREPDAAAGGDCASLVCEDCQAEDDDHPAAFTCTGGKCVDRLICEDHAALHQRRKHELVALAPASKLRTRSSQACCPKHTGVPIRYYCSTHEVLVCSECVLEEHPKASHRIVSVDELREVAEARLRMLADTCRTASSAVLEDAKFIEDLGAEMTRAKAESVDLCTAAVRAFKCAVDSQLAAVIHSANKLAMTHSKTQEAEVSELTVCGGQLEAAAQMCENALTGGRTAPLDQLNTASVVEIMLRAHRRYDGPRVPPVVECAFRYDALQAALQSAFSLVTKRPLAVSADASSISGPGTVKFVCGEPAANVVVIVVKTDDGVMIEEVEPADVTVDAFVEVHDARGRMSVLRSVEITKQSGGRLQLRYDVTDGCTRAIILTVTVCGVVLTGMDGHVVHGTSLLEVCCWVRLCAVHPYCVCCFCPPTPVACLLRAARFVTLPGVRRQRQSGKCSMPLPTRRAHGTLPANGKQLRKKHGKPRLLRHGRLRLRKRPQ